MNEEGRRLRLRPGGKEWWFGEDPPPWEVDDGALPGTVTGIHSRGEESGEAPPQLVLSGERVSSSRLEEGAGPAGEKSGERDEAGGVGDGGREVAAEEEGEVDDEEGLGKDDEGGGGVSGGRVLRGEL